MTARRNFGKQSGLVQFTRNSRAFNESNPTLGATRKNALRTNLSGVLPMPVALQSIGRMNYSLATDYNDTYTGQRTLDISPSLTTRYKSLVLTTALDYSTTGGAGVADETLSAKVNARGFWRGNLLQLGTTYDIMPENQLQDISAGLRRTIRPDLSVETEIAHNVVSGANEAEVSADWRTGRAVVGPRVQASSEGSLFAGVTVSFSNINEPFADDYRMLGQSLNGTGGVSARIFLDANGDGLYTEGEELLPEVEVRALQAHRNAFSGEDGIAFMPDLPESVLTDIAPMAESFPDPFYISLFEGVSVRPRRGVMSKVDFPVVVGGEMDGQVDYVDKDGIHSAARRLNIQLIAPDGRVEQSAYTAPDGYYAISGVRPGVYYINADVTEYDTGGYTLPRLIEFRADGSVFFGTNREIAVGHRVPFRFRSVNAAPSGEKRTRVITPADIASREVQIEIGDHHSRLGMTMAWYGFRMRANPWNKLFTLAKPLDDVQEDPKTAKLSIPLRPVRPISTETAAQVCTSLQDMGYDCAVVIETRYKDYGQTADAATKKPT